MRKKTGLKLLSAFVAAVMMTVCLAATIDGATPRLSNPLFDRYGMPQATALTIIDMRVQDTANGDTKDAIVTAKVIQGLVNRTGANKLYLYNDCTDAVHNIGGQNWNAQADWVANADELKNLPKTTLSRWTSGADAGLHRLIENYKASIRGYVIWDDRTSGDVNMGTAGAAVTIAAQTGGIAVSPSVYNLIVGWGYSFPVLVDLRTNNFASDHDAMNWCIDNYWAASNQNEKSVFSLGADSFAADYATAYNEGAIDYAVATKGFAFNINMVDAGDDTVLLKLCRKYTEGRLAILGWVPTHPGGTGTGETPACLNGTSYYVLGGNGLSNFSVYGSFPDSSVSLPAAKTYAVNANDVYIAFLMTDGDALHCVYRGMFDKWTKDRSADFGKIPITWTIAPQLANLAPAVFNYFARNLPAQADTVNDSASDLTIGWADKVNGSGDTGSAALAGSFKEYADLSDIHTIWTVHSQEDSQRSDLCNWNQVTIGYTNSQIAIHKANLNTNTTVCGMWDFGYNPSVASLVSGIKSIVSNNSAGKPCFMVVNIGAPFDSCPDPYGTVTAAASQLRASPGGRTYHFVNVRDMGATYRNYGGPAGPGGTSGLTNGDFELNPINQNGWGTHNWASPANFTWATDYKHGGSYSAKVSGTNINAGYQRDGATKIGVAPGTQYTISAWVKTSSVTGTGAWLWLEQQESTGGVIGGTRWDSAKMTGTQDWQKVSYTFTTASNCTNIDYYLHLEGAGTAWFDDVTLTQGNDTPPPPQDEKIINGTYELNPVNANGWVANNWGGSPAFAWATDYVHGGAYSAKISGTNMTAANFTQENIILKGNAAVTLGGWLRTNAFTGTGAYFAVQEFDSSGVEIPGTYWESNHIPGTNDWMQAARSWTTNAGCSEILIRAIANGSGTAWFDDLTLK